MRMYFFIKTANIFIIKIKNMFLYKSGMLLQIHHVMILSFSFC